MKTKKLPNEHSAKSPYIPVEPETPFTPPWGGLRPGSHPSLPVKPPGRLAKAPLFIPPPHANAEVHKRIMARLEASTPAEIAESAVRAGIYTADGELTEHYRDSEGGT